MTFTIYALPALVAFLTKACVLLYDRFAHIRGYQAKLFILFVLAFALHNLVEVGFFVRVGKEMVHRPEYLGRLWFSSAALAVAFFLHFSFLSATDFGKSAWMALLYLPALGLQVLLWGGSLLIVGFEPMSYTFTKIPGPFYFLWEGYVIGYLVCSVGLLIYGACSLSAARKRLQNNLLLLGFVPLLALALTVIALQRFGFRGFNATATLPFASTFLLLVAAYAVYHRRLLDVAFYIPWSKARRRKSELYSRLERMAGEIREIESPWEILEHIADGLRCRVALLGGPQPWNATPRNDHGSGERALLAEFPREALENIDRVVTADEIAHSDPELYELMARYKVGAIVPFRTHRTIPGYCLLLGEEFNEEIYSALDFKVADRLFSAMAQRFFEDFLLVRSQLQQVQEKLHGAKRNLMRTEQSLTGVRLKLTVARKQNRTLRDELARLRRANFKLIKPEENPGELQETLDSYLAEREREALLAALRRANGKRPAAARLLGISLRVLNRLLAHHGIDPDSLRDP